MKKEIKERTNAISRRKFLSSVSAITGIGMVPFANRKIFAGSGKSESGSTVKVAVTEADSYDRELIRNKVQHLIDSLGGLEDIVKPEDTVAIKINLTGGSTVQDHERLAGADVRDTIWTHPEVMRAVCEILIDYGVKAENITIVEALWDQASYEDFGYKEIVTELGLQFIDLEKPDPYDDFVNISTGENKFYYESFIMNQVLRDVDCYISIPKMKHHYSAGATHAVKNQIGAVPVSKYNNNGQAGHRASLHSEGGESADIHLPKAITDLYLARPIDLAINDGVRNCINAEGPWVNVYENAEYGVLLASKDAIALDTVSTKIMGIDPEGDYLALPNGDSCLNYLRMLADLDCGTNKLSDIEMVGDAADILVGIDPEQENKIAREFSLSQNYPNPFNPSTTFIYNLPKTERVSIKIVDITGREVDTLINSIQNTGRYEITWQANNYASGIYFCIMQAGDFHDSIKITLKK